MSTASTAVDSTRIDFGKWLTGAGAGAVGAVVASTVLFATGAFDPSTLTVEALGVLFMPGAVFGLLYAAIASFGRLTGVATELRTGAGLGFLYGIAFWMTTIISGPFSIGGLLAGVAFGVTIGVLYAASPYVA